MSKSVELKYNSELTPKISFFYALMKETRNKLLKAIEDIEDIELIDYMIDRRKVESIGTLLLHIAAVEWSWIFEDIEKRELPEEWKFGFPLRRGIEIAQIQGKQLDFYLKKLEKVRNDVFEKLKEFTDEDLTRKIKSEGYEFTIEWILYHLIEHELEHIGQILLLKRLYRLGK